MKILLVDRARCGHPNQSIGFYLSDEHNKQTVLKMVKGERLVCNHAFFEISVVLSGSMAQSPLVYIIGNHGKQCLLNIFSMSKSAESIDLVIIHFPDFIFKPLRSNLK